MSPVSIAQVIQSTENTVGNMTVRRQELRTGRVYDTSRNPFLLPYGGEAGDPFTVCWDGVWHLYTLSRNLRQDIQREALHACNECAY